MTARLVADALTPRHAGPSDAACGVAQDRLEPASTVALVRPIESLPATGQDRQWTPAQGRGDGEAARLISVPFQIGARTLASVRRRLRRVAWSLDDALTGRLPAVGTLGAGEDGWLLTSVPEALLADIAVPGAIMLVRQRYRRWWIDLTAGAAAWRAGLSANARAQIGRKAKRLGPHVVKRYRKPAEIAAFHPAARAVSALTYQERLLGSGLPADPTELVRLAAVDRVRAWLLCVEGRAVAYLCCTADGATLRYDHVGHDPAWSDRSPGAVLQAAALAELFGDRFARFDFTKGEGQHKRQLATGSVACADVLVLRRTVGNRGLVAVLRGWGMAVDWGKRVEWLRRLGAPLRR